MRYISIVLVIPVLLSLMTSSPMLGSQKFGLLRKLAKPVNIEFGDEGYLGKPSPVDVSLAYFSSGRVLVSFQSPPMMLEPYITTLAVDGISAASETGEILEATSITLSDDFENQRSQCFAVGYAQEYIVIAPQSGVSRLAIGDIVSSKEQATIDVEWVTLESAKLPDRARIVGVALDEDNELLYVLIQGIDSIVLMSGTLLGAEIDSVWLTQFGPHIQPADDERLGRARVGLLHNNIFVLQQDIIETGHWLPPYEYLAGRALLTVLDKTGKVCHRIEVDNMGTDLADVYFGNSLQIVDGMLYVKVGCNIWRYAEEGHLELVLSGSRLQGFPACVTPEGVVVYCTSDRLYWLGTDPAKYASIPPDYCEEEILLTLPNEPSPDWWLYYVATDDLLERAHSIID